MAYDFSKPQRQSAAGIIIMAANNVQKFIRAMIIPLAIFVVKAETKALYYTALAIITLLIIAVIISYLSYRRFLFHLDDHKQEFIIQKGILSRKQLTIQLDKIQQVNINQSVLQKLIGVYSLQIDTPGGDSKEVSIQAIDENIAYQLKEHLLNGKNTVPLDAIIPTQPVLEETTPFIKLSATTLFKVGLTTNYASSLALLTAFAYTIYHNAKELLGAFDNDNGQVEEIIRSGVSVASVGILITLFLITLLVINVIRIFIHHFNFEISRHKLSLLISSGIIAKKNTLLNPNKVQITEYHQNYFQKKLGIINLTLKQANSGEVTDEKDLEKANLQIPGCNAAEKDEILRLIFGNVNEQGASYRPNYRFVNLPIIFTLLVPIVAFLVAWFNLEIVKPYYPLAIIYFFLASLMIYLSYKRHRLTVNQDFIIKRSGIWDISNEIIVPRKIQAITTFQYPWHKGVDVGHVNLHTAAGVIHFKYGNYTEIKRLVNYWLYQIESGSEEWM